MVLVIKTGSDNNIQLSKLNVSLCSSGNFLCAFQVCHLFMAISYVNTIRSGDIFRNSYGLCCPCLVILVMKAKGYSVRAQRNQCSCSNNSFLLFDIRFLVIWTDSIARICLNVSACLPPDVCFRWGSFLSQSLLLNHII